MEQSQDSSLHQQFQALQEQQKKKLMKRKQKQEDKIKEQNTKNEEVNGLGVPDNMDLKLSQPIPQDSIFNEELNNHLQEQLRELKDETGRLYKLLSERDHEVRKLKKKRDEERQAFSGMGGGMATDAAATKIVELSKKNRELTAELESEKTKLKQLLLKLREAEKLNSSKATLSSRSPRSTREELRDPIEIQADKTAAELKTTQEKLNQATAKLGEFRTQVATLKQDLKLAHKALSNEVGEGVNISALLTAGNSNWRGRAQQILILQKKVSDLKAQLQELQQLRPSTEMSLEDQFMSMGVGEDGGNTARSTMSLRSVKTGGSGARIDEVQKNRLKQMEKDRREAKEKAQTELHSMEEDYKRLKEKMEAAKARNKVLSNDLKSCKQQITVLTDKGKHDNELIEALMKQQGHLKTLLDEKTAGFEHTKKRQEQSTLEMQLQTQKDANIVEQLKRIVAEKEEKVRQLEDEIAEMQQNRSISRFDSHTMPPQPPLKSDMNTPAPSSRQTVYSSSRQRTPSRQSRENTTVLNRVSSQNGMRPASTGSMSQVAMATGTSEEVRRQFQEYKSLLQVAEVERDRVMELIKVLQQRCDESNQKVTDTQKQVTELKQRNAQFEKQLDRLKVETSKGSAKKTSKIQVSAMSSVQDLLREDVSVSQETTDELQSRLAIQVDENNALKAALQSTLQSKDEDLKLYQQMMEQTKQVFLTGLRQYRQTSS
ncbi:coiled-coil domain-containing protein 13-like [Apostichopus japonicus]